MDNKRIHNDYGWKPSDGDYSPPRHYVRKKSKPGKVKKFIVKSITDIKSRLNKKLFA